MGVYRVLFKPSAERAFLGLPRDIQKRLDKRLLALRVDPRPRSLASSYLLKARKRPLVLQLLQREEASHVGKVTGQTGTEPTRCAALDLTGATLVCFYAFMRTTVELPPVLLRKAKMRAAARGESLKALLTRAVAAELGQGPDEPRRRRLELPLFGNPTGRPVDLSGLDLARALAHDDAVLAGRGRRGR